VSARQKLNLSPEEKTKDRQLSSSSDMPPRPVSSPVKRTVKQHARTASDMLLLTSKKENGVPPLKSKLSSAKPARSAVTVSAGTVIPQPPSSTPNLPTQSPSTPTRKRVIEASSRGQWQ
jgi:hypothetical protein